MKATVIGAGLAGCEAAWQLARAGCQVDLVDMKPGKKPPAHTLDTPAELVCSNSLGSARVENASGLLKEEMRRLGSLLMEAAQAARVPAGGALAVDREAFSGYVDARLGEKRNIRRISREADSIPDTPCVVATGPLTSDAMADAVGRLVGGGLLYFHDASAPIVEAGSVDMNQAFRGARYGRGGEYINCPMNREEYEAFHRALVSAELAPRRDFDPVRIFEGCMPIEELARRGFRSMAFGPLKPVGFEGYLSRRPFAVVQLRQDNSAATLYNMVGFQTQLKFGEQKRVFSMIPGLGNARFARYGVMHRNTYIDSPRCLTANYRYRERGDLYFAGQITGVEGYAESASSGLLAGLSLARRLAGRPEPDFGSRTVIGALAGYVKNPANAGLSPMNANFGLLEPLSGNIKGKDERARRMAERSLAEISRWLEGEEEHRI